MNYKELLKKAKKYVKKPIPIKAIKMNEEFEVETLEGRMKGKPGDYLVEGIRGELYVCDGEIFEETYICVDEYKKGLIFLRDEDMSILNLPFIAKYFLRIGDNGYDTFYIEVSVNGDIYRLTFFYPDKDLMLHDKEFVKLMIARYNQNKLEEV
jgi:hypothetical protein